METTWYPVPVDGFGDYFEATKDGLVRRRSKGSRGPGSILAARPNDRGYLRVELTIGSKAHGGLRRSVRVARIVAAINHGPPPTPKHEVNHIDGDKLNNAPGNLEWVTHKRNIQHAFDTGLKRAKFGEAHPQAKLTVDQVRDIRQRLARGWRCNHLARHFGVCADLIYKIRDRRLWKSVA